MRHVSAGEDHIVLLQSDGYVVACGANMFEQSLIPLLTEGMSYTQVSAGATHSVLLRSDGSAVACGLNISGQCNIPPLDGLSYIQVSAGWNHTVLLRSDGTLLVEGITRSNAASRVWQKECRTWRFQQVGIIQCFCEAMAKLLLVAKIILDNATFLRQSLEFATRVIFLSLEISSCSWILLMK